MGWIVLTRTSTVPDQQVSNCHPIPLGKPPLAPPGDDASSCSLHCPCQGPFNVAIHTGQETELEYEEATKCGFIVPSNLGIGGRRGGGQATKTTTKTVAPVYF